MLDGGCQSLTRHSHHNELNVMKNSVLFVLLLLAVNMGAQDVRSELKTKNPNCSVLIKEEKLSSGDIMSRVLLLTDGIEEFVGSIPGRIEIVSAFLSIKYSGRQNLRLSLVFKYSSSGLRFFSADRFLGRAKGAFPYELREGKWMVTTVNTGGALLERNPSGPKHQVESVHWHNAKLFRINYKKDERRGRPPIESQTFAEIDGELEWIGPCKIDFTTEKGNLIEN